jgi:hypothetical protein
VSRPGVVVETDLAVAKVHQKYCSSSK